ncbi:hypothetical protein ACU8KH_03046 [Lachancea thermotolerans]
MKRYLYVHDAKDGKRFNFMGSAPGGDKVMLGLSSTVQVHLSIPNALHTVHTLTTTYKLNRSIIQFA